MQGTRGREAFFRREDKMKEFDEKVIRVRRVSKKTKGGNKMGFSILVVVGDRKGRVGVGLGKAADVVHGIQKGVAVAKRKLIRVPLVDGRTIPYAIRIKEGAAKLLLRPAPEGSGIIAGGSVRAVLEAVGIRDISAKILGTNNPASNAKAAVTALKKLAEMEEKRSKRKVVVKK